MKHPKHDAAPKAWRGVQNRTGDYDMDASIEHIKRSKSTQKAMLETLENHISEGNAYGYRTNYRGYGGLSGDD